MKIASILFLLYIGFSPVFGQDKDFKKVGIVYDLCDSIYQNHVGLIGSNVSVKSYPQDANLNLIIEGFLDNEIKNINCLEVHKLEFSAEDIYCMMVRNDLSPVSSYDMIMVVKDVGISVVYPILPYGYYTNNYRGRGIITFITNKAQIYANLGVELINTSNGRSRTYHLDDDLSGSEWRLKALLRTKPNYFSNDENKKELSNEKILDIQKYLVEMYRLQVFELFYGDRLYRTVFELFNEKGKKYKSPCKWNNM